MEEQFSCGNDESMPWELQDRDLREHWLADQRRGLCVSGSSLVCGLNNDLSIIHELNPTYHVYEYGSQSILKKTYWFNMESTYSGKLTPQEEEDIIDCRWVPIEELGKYMVSAYPLIANLLKDFILDK